MTADPTAPVRGFVRCPTCDGQGFLRTGDFATRSFPKCPACQGLGDVRPPEPQEHSIQLSAYADHTLEWCDLGI